MVTLKLDRARMKLIASFVAAYLKLDGGEDRVFQRTLSAKLPPGEKEHVVEIVTSWEQKGIEKGIEQGIQQGRVEALREVLADILSSRFGPLSKEIAARMQKISTSEELRDLSHRALTAGSLRELGF